MRDDGYRCVLCAENHGLKQRPCRPEAVAALEAARQAAYAEFLEQVRRMTPAPARAMPRLRNAPGDGSDIDQTYRDEGWEWRDGQWR